MYTNKHSKYQESELYVEYPLPRYASEKSILVKSNFNKWYRLTWLSNAIYNASW